MKKCVQCRTTIEKTIPFDVCCGKRLGKFAHLMLILCSSYADIIMLDNVESAYSTTGMLYMAFGRTLIFEGPRSPRCFSGHLKWTCYELEVNFKWTGILFLVLFMVVVYQTKWTAQALILSFLFRIWSSDLQDGLVRNRRIEVIDFDLNFDQTNDLTALIIAFKALAFHTRNEI